MGDVVRGFSVEYEPQLVEEAVFCAVRRRAEAAEFHAGRDACYEVADAEAQEARFRQLHGAWFERLGLGQGITEALDEQPSIPANTGRCLVTVAPSRRDEGAELFVSPATGTADAPRRTVVLRLRPETLASRDRLRPFLRHELLHIADMLDPRFGYEPGRAGTAGGSLRERWLRERYRVLWATFVDGRLVRRGWAPPETRDERLAHFARAFPMLGEYTEEAFQRVFAGEAVTHATLIAFASDPAGALGRGSGGPHPGERCPLCGFPTHEFAPEPERLPCAARELIHRSFANWNADQGLCRQCADLYQALAGASPTTTSPRTASPGAVPALSARTVML